MQKMTDESVNYYHGDDASHGMYSDWIILDVEGDAPSVYEEEQGDYVIINYDMLENVVETATCNYDEQISLSAHRMTKS